MRCELCSCDKRALSLNGVGPMEPSSDPDPAHLRSRGIMSLLRPPLEAQKGKPRGDMRRLPMEKGMLKWHSDEACDHDRIAYKIHDLRFTIWNSDWLLEAMPSCTQGRTTSPQSHSTNSFLSFKIDHLTTGERRRAINCGISWTLHSLHIHYSARLLLDGNADTGSNGTASSGHVQRPHAPATWPFCMSATRIHDGKPSLSLEVVAAGGEQERAAWRTWLPRPLVSQPLSVMNSHHHR
ncbi:hypothetical protein IE81DRAFT_147632 [Ceraceosorus guamensis]|uniref:Uncharacterized protein n=1 Tax=Ceraceosorus guamensis TaxID=1522189 RepID=A0A316VWU9_9BASI|nr:hypothetical protein IE81DRAFT_147632 [Ceraceosorus guamensis]PWN41929.1 hypothetical protein IE81DRAFT_147632 [Ceraceosorus guamensis]